VPSQWVRRNLSRIMRAHQQTMYLYIYIHTYILLKLAFNLCQRMKTLPEPTKELHCQSRNEPCQSPVGGIPILCGERCGRLLAWVSPCKMLSIPSHIITIHNRYLIVLRARRNAYMVRMMTIYAPWSIESIGWYWHQHVKSCHIA